ncbi:hypothetical protein D3C78_1871400 [compost metagenome]
MHRVLTNERAKFPIPLNIAGPDHCRPERVEKKADYEWYIKTDRNMRESNHACVSVGLFSYRSFISMSIGYAYKPKCSGLGLI